MRAPVSGIIEMNFLGAIGDGLLVGLWSLVGLFGLYLVARVVTAAYFASRSIYDAARRSHPPLCNPDQE